MKNLHNKSCLAKIILTFMPLLAVISCHNNSTITAEGYIEGKYTYLSSPQAGKLQQINVERGNKVAPGDIIFKLDPQPEADAVQKALKNLTQQQQILQDIQKGARPTSIEAIIAQRQQALAALDLATKTLQRTKQLFKTKVISKAQLDIDEANYQNKLKEVQRVEANLKEAQLGQRENQIKAQQEVVAAAQAELTQARWALAQKTGTAPQAGTIDDVYYRVGEFVTAGSPIASMLAPKNVKLIFFVPETILSKIQLQQPITFTCDNCPTLTATISFIASEAEYTPQAIFSKESRHKLVYRVEAEVPPDVANKLHVGQPIDIMI